MPTNSYRVRVTKDHLVFSAGHFITIETPQGEICEHLHGHNWRTCVDVCGPLNHDGYVFDFIALRDEMQKIVADLDHRMLLPKNHPQIKVTAGEREVEVRYADKRWVFPTEDCRILPIAQTTAELLAHWIGAQLRQKLGDAGKSLTWIRVHVEENFGQWATCELRNDPVG
jgi:6-pyruvoyltetrahydropterin/6-carboxytetrahydropterin synthase